MRETISVRNIVMRVGEFLLGKIIAPLFVLIIAPTVIGLVLKLSTGNWNSFPLRAWVAIAIFIFLWFAVILIRNRFRQINNSGSRIVFMSIPLYDWVEFGECEYAGVIWKIHVARPSSFEEIGYGDIRKKRIRELMTNIKVITPPRCPKCKTEIEQSRSFWGGYIWKCVNCGFRKHNRYSYYHEEDHVNKIVRCEFERQIEDDQE